MHAQARLTLISLLCFGTANAAMISPTPGEVRTVIQQSMKQGGLKSVYTKLEKEFGAKAELALEELVQSDHERDETRYASLYALTRVAPAKTLGLIPKLASNKNWILRDAALKNAPLACMNATCAAGLAPVFSHALKDDALVVRTTAVDTIATMKLASLSPDLVNALFSDVNTHGGKPLWIHGHILAALESLKPESALTRLVDYLEKHREPELRMKTIHALEAVSGKNFAGKKADEQVFLWKRLATSEKTF